MKADRADVLIVLGARVMPDFSPSKVLLSRLALALSLYQEKRLPIICCGAQGDDEPIAESEMMRDWLLARGVEPSDVLVETQSRDTLSNLKNARAIMDAHGLLRALIVTSDYHIPRALAISKRFGILASGRGAKTAPWLLTKNCLREVLAWGKFFLTYFWPRMR